MAWPTFVMDTTRIAGPGDRYCLYVPLSGMFAFAAIVRFQQFGLTPGRRSAEYGLCRIDISPR